VRSPKWFTRKVRQVCDGPVARSGSYRDTVRSETVIPSFSNSPWIRGAPQRRFSLAMCRMSPRMSASMGGLPGRRCEFRRQHPQNPSRPHRATVAGWTSTSASLHRGQNRCKQIRSKRSGARNRRSERARTPSWWRSARISQKTSKRVNRADRSAATIRTASRIGCRIAKRYASVNDSLPDAIMANDS
jgi:hypothetical protein